MDQLPKYQRDPVIDPEPCYDQAHHPYEMEEVEGFPYSFPHR